MVLIPVTALLGLACFLCPKALDSLALANRQSHFVAKLLLVKRDHLCYGFTPNPLLLRSLPQKSLCGLVLSLA